MGWTESSPAFSAVTETFADVVNEHLETNLDIPPEHPLESLASTQVPLPDPSASYEYPVHESGPLRQPLAYVDNFIKLVQGWYNALRVWRHTY